MSTVFRDFLLYVYFAIAIVSAAGGSKIGFSAVFVLFILLCAYFPLLKRAERRSRDMGLSVVILLWVPKFFAELMLFSAGERIRGRWKKACEIHLNPAVVKTFETKEILQMLERDLLLVYQKMQGDLLLWRTSFPVPARIRAMIRGNGNAFWKKGDWFIPPFPLTSRDIDRKRARIGAFLIEHKNVLL